MESYKEFRDKRMPMFLGLYGLLIGIFLGLEYLDLEEAKEQYECLLQQQYAEKYLL